MDVVVHYTAEVPTPLGESFFLEVAHETLTRCPLPVLGEKKITLNAIAVSPERITALNEQYRGKAAVTDILSFGEYTDTNALSEEKKKDLFLGELFFCQDFIEQAAKEDQVSLEREMAYIFSHGILHLLGYNHSEEMFTLQDAVTDSLSPVTTSN